MEAGRGVTVEIKELSFTYPGLDGRPPPGSKPLIHDFSLTLCSGDRCLLVGANGAGKTTILKLLGGKHMVDPAMVRVLGRSAFHDTSLTSSGDLAYLGGEWRRDVAFAGFDVPLQMDISAEKMIFGVQGIDPNRRDRLIKVLDIDLSWRLHKVSDGQRRRVQICMGLLRPFKVLLLDEAYVAQGRLQFAKPLSDIKEVKEISLMRTVERWLRKEIEDQRMKRKERRTKGEPNVDSSSTKDKMKVLNNGWAGGRLHSTLAGEGAYNLSSNRVLRQ